MVASSAKISRPRWPASRVGAKVRARAMKASISGRAEAAAGLPAPGAGAGVLSRSVAMILAARRSNPSISGLSSGRAGGPVQWLNRGAGGLLGDQVLNLERLFPGSRPLGAGGGAAPAALIEGQLEPIDERAHFLVRGDVGHARARAERRLVEVIEGAQAARKHLAIDEALGKAVDRAEAEAQAQVVEALGDGALVARAEDREPVAHHDPVGQRAINDAPLAPGVAHHFGVMALAGDREGRRIDRAEHVEVDEAVVEWRDQ